MEELVYLKPNVVIEPLIDRWYAWSHLISPATAAMNITGRHLKIMGSYLQAPHVHAGAVRNPKMLGGPFMDIPIGKKEAVRQLRDKTLAERKSLVGLSEAIKALDGLLKKHPKGYSMDGLYEQVPEPLKGYVELTYDLNNNPSFRFFEALLYGGEHYDPSMQSVALWLTDNDDRPFVLSTPRVDDDEVLHLDIPFGHPFIDAVSRMKRTPGLLSDVRRLLPAGAANQALFETFFTTTPPPAYQKYQGDKVRMRYFGHACILIETREVSILVDPLISYYGYAHDVSRFSDADLPDTIDYVLITHNHQDHILFETLLPLRHKVKNIIVPRTTSGALQDPNLKLMFNHIGFPNVTELGEMELIAFRDCRIRGIPFIGEHSDLNIHSKLCYHVQIGAFKILFVADACNLEARLYEHVQKQVGDVDVVFLGMECEGAPLTWLYGPLLTEELARDKDGSRRLAGSDYERGKKLVDTFHPKEVYVYAMGMEPWLKFISSIQYTEASNPIIASNKLIAYCRESGRIAERLFGEKELLYASGAEEAEAKLAEPAYL
ncbi:MAG: beta-lactamase domain protein [uncultured Cytophagales bacterium]|uniref:Beta-lactamase domain protein n=1 Tax=uncultured Cytophagales bacterium TaxID=158755 RepID=A0A6J4LQJ0_9SPHI|nr:MAG: beta-lactamase domain protein [uncultured Cytophagales bacterium]